MRRYILAPLLLLCCTCSGWCLKFQILQQQNTKVLLVYDCHLRDNPKSCSGDQNEFMLPDEKTGYPGDAAEFRKYLRQPGIEEVWVQSNGGLVDAAIEMARDLRASHIPVRVPGRARCVSSCTVFFMGGILRYIDKGATYEVHSASSWQGRVDWHEFPTPETHTIDPEIADIARDPDKNLREAAEAEQKDARTRAMRLLRLFQNTLLIPTRKAPVSENGREIKEEAERDLPPLEYLQPDSKARKQDVKRIKAEGRAAVQDVMMRLEREQMASAIQWLEQRTDLGPRSDTALEMVRMMYMESIRETSTLSQSELERRGYVTPQMD